VINDLATPHRPPPSPHREVLTSPSAQPVRPFLPLFDPSSPEPPHDTLLDSLLPQNPTVRDTELRRTPYPPVCPTPRVHAQPHDTPAEPLPSPPEPQPRSAHPNPRGPTPDTRRPPRRQPDVDDASRPPAPRTPAPLSLRWLARHAASHASPPPLHECAPIQQCVPAPGPHPVTTLPAPPPPRGRSQRRAKPAPRRYFLLELRSDRVVRTPIGAAHICCGSGDPRRMGRGLRVATVSVEDPDERLSSR